MSEHLCLTHRTHGKMDMENQDTGGAQFAVSDIVAFQLTHTHKGESDGVASHTRGLAFKTNTHTRTHMD